jgi:hypothetical protein
MNLVQLVSVSRGREQLMASFPRPVVHILRGLVFVPLFLFGLNAAFTAAYFGGGGGPMYVRQARVWVPLVFALAAPFIWVLAHRHGDRWTWSYLGVGIGFIATAYALVVIF